MQSSATSRTGDRWRVAVPRALSTAALFRPQGELVVLEGAAMGTTWRVSYVGTRAGTVPVRRAIIRILDRVIACFSPWDPASELNQFNEALPGNLQPASADFAKVLTCALRIAEESDGACDPALGALIDMWGFGPAPRRAEIPSACDIDRALRVSGWQQIKRDRSGSRFSRGLARLDLCGVAKGYAVDLIARALQENGVASALVEIGGELAGYGVKPDGAPWWVAIDGETRTNAPFMVALHGLSIATSGCERCFTHAGRTYAHTIDPRTGRPIDNGMISATVLHPSCMQADAYATALMVMGGDAGIAFAERRGLAVVIRHRVAGAAVERVSPQFQAMLDD